MAKVDGPLFSLEARGKIGDAIVFFPWKGRHVVRQWLKPTNPQSALQGYVRASMKAIGKFISKILSISAGDGIDSLVYADATSSADAGMNWNAWLGGGFLAALQVAGAFQTSAFTDFVEEYSSSINSTVKSAFDTEAATLGLEAFTMGYGYTTEIPAGLQLYMGAVACYKKTISNASPWNVDPVSWDTDDVTMLGTAMTTDS